MERVKMKNEKTDPEVYTFAINSHCKERYPREFASPERLRSPVTSNNHLNQLVTAYGPGHNCFVSVYSFSEWLRSGPKNKLDYTKAVIDTIFIDLDWKVMPEIALYETRLLELYYRHRNVDIRVNFTGKKGFAVYIDFEPIDIPDEDKKPVIRKFIEDIRTKLSLKTLDKQCIDGISRISRLPNTKHHDTGLYCIPLNRDQLWHMDGFNHIQELAKTPSEERVIVAESPYIHKKLTKIQENLIEEVVNIPVATKPVPFEFIPKQQAIIPGSSLCPGVMEIALGVQEGVRDASLCGLVAGLNLQLQMEYKEILNAVGEWSTKCTPALDYDSFILANKVNEIINREYRPCTFLIRAGVNACNKCPVMKN